MTDISETTQRILSEFPHNVDLAYETHLLHKRELKIQQDNLSNHGTLEEAFDKQDKERGS